MLNTSLRIWFKAKKCPAWSCPACGRPELSIQEGSFRQSITLTSRQKQFNNRGWNPPDDAFVYSCILECKNSLCGEVVASSGEGFTDYEFDPNLKENVLVTEFRATSFCPPLMAFSIPKSCPDAVRISLVSSFSLYLVSPSAAANAIRVSIEELLTALNVPTARKMHVRLENLPPLFAVHKNALNAIRWLGNAGSHKYDEVKATDIEEAFEVMEFVLNDIYNEKAARILEMVERIGDAFGPKKN